MEDIAMLVFCLPMIIFAAMLEGVAPASFTEARIEARDH